METHDKTYINSTSLQTDNIMSLNKTHIQDGDHDKTYINSTSLQTNNIMSLNKTHIQDGLYLRLPKTDILISKDACDSSMQ